jgi:hypothetical protein
MTAKQYLQQSFRLNQKISANLQSLERLRALAASIPPANLSRDRIQAGGASDRVGNAVAKIIGLEAAITAEIGRFAGLKEEIMECLGLMPDNDLRLILQKRYLNFQKWEHIAADLNYTRRHAMRLHGEAIQAFQEQFKDVLECHI